MRKLVCQACAGTDPKAFNYTHHGLAAGVHHLVVAHEFTILTAMEVIKEITDRRGEPVS